MNEQTLERKMQYCPHCGTKLPEFDIMFCGNCGSRLKGFKEEPAKAVTLLPMSQYSNASFAPKPVMSQTPISSSSTLDFGSVWKPMAITLIVCGAAVILFGFSDLLYLSFITSAIVYFMLVHYERKVGRENDSNKWLKEQAEGDSCLVWFWISWLFSSGGWFTVVLQVIILLISLCRYLIAYSESPAIAPNKTFIPLYLADLIVLFIIGQTYQIFLFLLAIGLLFILRGVWAYQEAELPAKSIVR